MKNGALRSSAIVRVRFFGDFACFTDPRTGTERISYPVPTATAARGLFETIYRKPEMIWIPMRVEVLKPIRFISIMMNEVAEKIGMPSASAIERGAQDDSHLDAPSIRAQRYTTMLRDVDYRITAKINCDGGSEDNTVEKHLAVFMRRITMGQCFRNPYFGMRNFPAFFELAEGNVPPPIREDLDVGMMPLTIFRPNVKEAEANPVFHLAKMRQGVVEYPIPQYL